MKETVAVPNAISYTVTFDEGSRTEDGCDYVRIFTDMTMSESCHPGIDKFSGRGGSQNWPGTDGRPPLIINRPSFMVHFYSDYSNTDWGFKLTARATLAEPEDNAVATTAGSEEEKTSDSAKDTAHNLSRSLNSGTLWFGQPPSRIARQRRSIRGFVAGAQLFAAPLNKAQVLSVSNRRNAPPQFANTGMGRNADGNDASGNQLERTSLDVLALMLRCTTASGPGATVAAAAFGQAKTSRHLLTLAFGSISANASAGSGSVLVLPASVRISALRLAGYILTKTHPDEADRQLGHLLGTADASVVDHLLSEIGRVLSPWCNSAATPPPDISSAPIEVRCLLRVAAVGIKRPTTQSPFLKESSSPNTLRRKTKS